MVTAGNILMKKKFDTEGLLPVDPFANRTLLTEKETNSVMGQA
jgi:hypothetical protein